MVLSSILQVPVTDSASNSRSHIRCIRDLTIRDGSAVLVVTVNGISVGAFDAEKVHGVSIGQNDAAVEERLARFPER